MGLDVVNLLLRPQFVSLELISSVNFAVLCILERVKESILTKGLRYE
jgi:hypothetical protein